MPSTFIPAVTCPNGAKRFASRKALSPRLTKTCVVRVFGADAAAKVTVPRVFERRTRSSLMVAFSQAAETFGDGLIPNWTTKPGTTRKSQSPS